MRTGELCRGCGSACHSSASRGESIEIECPICNGERDDCPHCLEGSIEINGCPREAIDGETFQALQAALIAASGVLPVAGGLLDQSAWFVAAWQRFENDIQRIDADRWARRNGNR